MKKFKSMTTTTGNVHFYSAYEEEDSIEKNKESWKITNFVADPKSILIDEEDPSAALLQAWDETQNNEQNDFEYIAEQSHEFELKIQESADEEQNILNGKSHRVKWIIWLTVAIGFIILVIGAFIAWHLYTNV